MRQTSGCESGNMDLNPGSLLVEVRHLRRRCALSEHSLVGCWSCIFFRLDGLPDVRAATVSTYQSHESLMYIQIYYNSEIPRRRCPRHWQSRRAHSTFQWWSLSRQTYALSLSSRVGICRLEVHYITYTLHRAAEEMSNWKQSWGPFQKITLSVPSIPQGWSCRRPSPFSARPNFW